MQIKCISAWTAILGFPVLSIVPHLLVREIIMNRRHLALLLPMEMLRETKLCSRYGKRSRNLHSLSPWRHWTPFVWPLRRLGLKIDVWENPVVYASTWDWSCLYGTMRSESEAAAQSSCSHSRDCLASTQVSLLHALWVQWILLWRQRRSFFLSALQKVHLFPLILLPPFSGWPLSLSVCRRYLSPPPPPPQCPPGWFLVRNSLTH